ncbi:MAG: hypothetical protein AAFS00_19855 [Bacteroidota bacterium]
MKPSELLKGLSSLCLFFTLTLYTYAQGVAINENGADPDPAAVIDVSSTTKGMLIPRMTTDQRDDILIPVEGLMIYNTDSAGFEYYSVSAFGVPSWGSISKKGVCQSGCLVDIDGDTRVCVVDSLAPDADVITFETDGTLKWLMKKNTLEPQNNLGSVYIGQGAGLKSTSGLFNVVVGDSALANNSSGLLNTAMGASTLKANTIGSSNTGLGATALAANTTGFNNTAVGLAALGLNADRPFLVAIGDSALFNNGSDIEFPSDALFNTALGSRALRSNRRGSGNTASGFRALYQNYDADGNTAFGYEASYSRRFGSFGAQRRPSFSCSDR